LSLFTNDALFLLSLLHSLCLKKFQGFTKQWWTGTAQDDKESIVWHKSILDGYWKEFRNRASTVTSLSEIDILNVEITKECMAAVGHLSKWTNN
jgi:hypothetical protein